MKIKKIVSWFVREILFLVTYVLNHLLDFLAEGREVINPTQRIQRLAYRFVYLVGVSTILFWISMAVIASCEVVRDEWNYTKDYVAGKLSKKVVIVPEVVEVEVEKVEKRLTNEEVDNIIKDVARETNFDERQLLAMIHCEGGYIMEGEHKGWYNLKATNTKNNSYDRGPAQWSRKHHPEVTDECAYDVRCSMEAVVKRVRVSGFGDWKASATCRANYLKS